MKTYNIKHVLPFITAAFMGTSCGNGARTEISTETTTEYFDRTYDSIFAAMDAPSYWIKACSLGTRHYLYSLEYDSLSPTTQRNRTRLKQLADSIQILDNQSVKMFEKFYNIQFYADSLAHQMCKQKFGHHK